MLDGNRLHFLETSHQHSQASSSNRCLGCELKGRETGYAISCFPYPVSRLLLITHAPSNHRSYDSNDRIEPEDSFIRIDRGQVEGEILLEGDTGHSYALSLHLAGDLDEVMGWVLDFGDVKARFKPFYAALDHHALDTVAGMGTPDCAGIATWALAQLAPSTPSLVRADVYQNDLDGALVWRGAA